MDPLNLKVRPSTESEFVVPEDVRRMTLEAVRTATEKSRDAGVRNLANSSQWFGLLPSVIEPETAGHAHSVRIISPEKYLEISLSAIEEYPSAPHDKLVVDGDFSLLQKRGVFFLSGELVSLCKVRTLVSLRPAVIRGDLRIYGEKDLREIHCSVTGDAAILNCPNLEEIQGEYFGSARFANCGMEYLAAGYRCAGSLRVHECKNLRVVNCEVGGDLTISASPLERTGGGMQVGGNLDVTGNGDALEVRGKIGGVVRHAGVELPTRGLPRVVTARKGLRKEKCPHPGKD